MRKIFLFLALLLLATSVFTSCREEGETPNNPNPPDNGENGEPAVTTDHPSLGKANFGGRTFTVLARGPDYTFWQSFDIYAKEENGDRINDAVYKRNRNVEAKYGIEIAQIDGKTTLQDDAYKEISAGTATFDLINMNIAQAPYLAQNRCLLDLHELDKLELNRPWWDQDANYEFQIGEKLYFTCNDISIHNYDGTWVYTFNKKILEENQLENPYQLVRDDEWTWDKFWEMAKEASRDLNGDGIRDERDQFGVVTETWNTYAMFLSTGEKITRKDENNYPVFSMHTDKSVQVIQKLFEMAGDKQNYTTKIGYIDFNKGHGLFTPTTIRTIRINFNEMESDFGLLPTPKYNKSQEQFYTAVSTKSLFGVPVTTASEDYDFVGTVVEALAFESRQILIPEYYNAILENRYLRDDDSREMLEIIFQNRVYDLNLLFTSWGGFVSYLMGIAPGTSGEFVSYYDSKIEAAQASLDETINLYRGME